jgi:hypothetical protein
MTQNFNPWLEIWTCPRATIRRIVSEKPDRSLWVLAAIYGFGSLIGNAQSLGFGQSLNFLAIFLIVILLSPIWGYIFFSLWSAVVYWIGKLFKGVGTFHSVRAAYAWSCVPLAINIPIWIILSVVFGQELFQPSFGSGDLDTPSFVLLFAALLIRLAMAVWSLVIYFNALAEVQSYSILKSILNVLASSVLLLLAAWILWGVSSHFMNPAAQMLDIGSMLPSFQAWAIDCYKL